MKNILIQSLGAFSKIRKQHIQLLLLLLTLVMLVLGSGAPSGSDGY